MDSVYAHEKRYKRETYEGQLHPFYIVQKLGNPQPDTMKSSPWWKEATIYQIYPRSFFDSNGDGEGDLQGITSKLQYVQELGVDAIWLSPFYTSPNKDGGYDVADPRDVDPRFGKLEDAKKLIEVAHSLGLKVLVDVVPNHFSDQHLSLIHI